MTPLEDFRARAREKARVALSARAKALLKREKKKPTRRRGRRVDMEEILDEWRSLPEAPSGKLGEFKQLMSHWLAHGRYFVDNSGVSTGPDFAFERVRALVARLQTMDALFPRV